MINIINHQLSRTHIHINFNNVYVTVCNVAVLLAACQVQALRVPLPLVIRVRTNAAIPSMTNTMDWWESF